MGLVGGQEEALSTLTLHAVEAQPWKARMNKADSASGSPQSEVHAYARKAERSEAATGS